MKLLPPPVVPYGCSQHRWNQYLRQRGLRFAANQRQRTLAKNRNK